MRTITFTISPEVEAQVAALADAAGVDIETCASRLLETLALPSRSRADVGLPRGPVVGDTGMTEEEMSDFLNQEIRESRAERAAKRPA